MARIHARRKGESSSTRPFKTKNPDWVPIDKSEIEETVVKLAKEGYSTSVMGLKLRDQYGVPSVKLATGKTITKILSENGVKFDIPEDLSNLMRKAVRLHTYLGNNPRDLHNRRSMQLVEAKIRRLVRYYKKKGIISPDWAYSIKTAKLQVE